ncbi:MAG: SMC family ATPase [Chloroflexi bacterium]|nr:SMC family ATPase [Chloroflexota bacterium]
MIPLKLEITNFLSYRDTAVLDFNGIHLACISGANGAGKSSILDAITWALFGQSRSRSDDDLVNRVASLGGDGAEVNLIFELEGSVYRVLRRKKARKRTILELQMATDETQSHWKTLSETKLRETQAAIENLLRMNYDTFINASFLLQGKADEFTTKTAGRRKEILADLLGVSVWDEYKGLAAERRKGEEGRILLLDGQLAEIEAELGEEAERKETLESTQAELAIVAQRLADKEGLLQQFRRAETAVSQQKQLVQNLSNNLTRAQNNLAGLEQTRQKRQTERDAYEEILAAAETIQADYVAWQDAEAELGAQQAQADEFNRRQQAKRPYELAITQAKSKLEQQAQELTTQAERVAAAGTEREMVAEKLASGKARLAELETAVAKLTKQEQAHHDAKSALQTLESERKLLAQELGQLRAQSRKIEGMIEEKTAVARNAQQAETQLAELTTQVAAIAEWHNQHAVKLGEKNNLETDQPRLRQEMNRHKERIDGLDGDTGSGDPRSLGGECPLCGQPLSESHRRDVLAQLQGEGAEMGDRFRANKERIAALTAEIAQLDGQIKGRDKLERNQQSQQQRLAKAEARLAEIETAVAEWENSGQAAQMADLEAKLADETAVAAQRAQIKELETAVRQKSALEKERQTQQRQIAQAEARLTEIERLTAEWEQVGQKAQAEVDKSLKTKNYATNDFVALAELDEQISAIGYDADAHEAARQKRDELADAPARHQALKQAEAAVKPLADMLAHLGEQIAAQRQTAADLTEQHETAVVELDRIAAEGGDLRGVEDEVFRLREEQIAANRRVGAAQQRLDVLTALEERRETLKSDRAGIALQVQRLKLLEKACGRDGVQALLIEQALPEIEDHANDLLDRLTNGDMRVSFETQRALKSREGMAETLDIQIRDSAGERPYANFSGGEQFRINFAIRLALSQILAKRAGARLQTLVIDEGFGSQDPNGRQRLVEAINAIQDDFKRILVITHIDELRDAFPTRIEVEKSVIGSTIAVA